MLANGTCRKTPIFQLEQEEGIVVGHENIKKCITSYYKTLFGPQKENEFSLNEENTEYIPQVTEQEKDFPTAAFTEKKIKNAVFHMEHNKALGPDGFPIESFQFFSEIMKEDP